MKTRITIIIDFDGMSMAELDQNVADGWGNGVVAADVIKGAAKSLTVNLDMAASAPCEIDVTVSELDA
jgi:hypothetical protein